MADNNKTITKFGLAPGALEKFKQLEEEAYSGRGGDFVFF